MENKKRVTIYIDPEIHAIAKAKKLNISNQCEIYLRYLTENADIDLKIARLEKELHDLRNISKSVKVKDSEMFDLYHIYKSQSRYSLDDSYNINWLRTRLRDSILPNDPYRILEELKGMYELEKKTEKMR